MPKFDLPKFDLPSLPKLEMPKVPTPKVIRADLAKVKLDTKPLYAGAGVAELAVTAVLEYAVGVQKRVEGYQKDATTRFADARRSVASLEPKTLQALAKAKLDETATTANGTYDDLAKRGEVFVARLRGTSAAKSAASTAKKAPVKKPTTRPSTAKKAPAKKA